MIPLSSTDCKWYSYALTVAMDSSHPQHKMGAVVVKGGALLSAACNHQTWGKHAERRALRPHQNYAGATIYVARRKGGCSFPCINCLNACRQAGIKSIVFVDRNLSLTKIRVR